MSAYIPTYHLLDLILEGDFKLSPEHTLENPLDTTEFLAMSDGPAFLHSLCRPSLHCLFFDFPFIRGYNQATLSLSLSLYVFFLAFFRPLARIARTLVNQLVFCRPFRKRMGGLLLGGILLCWSHSVLPDSKI